MSRLMPRRRVEPDVAAEHGRRVAAEHARDQARRVAEGVAAGRRDRRERAGLDAAGRAEQGARSG